MCAQIRPIEQVRTFYRKDSLDGRFPLGEIEPLALPFESYKLAFTPGLLASVYQPELGSNPSENLLPDPEDLLGGQKGDQGGYVDLDDDGHWWIPSGRIFYSSAANIPDEASTAVSERKEAREHFFLPRKLANPFGQSNTVDYDEHHLLVARTEDAVNNVVAARNDYRVLQPSQMTDWKT